MINPTPYICRLHYDFYVANYNCKCYIAHMIQRAHNSILIEKLKFFPIITILGPRQCGKTTLIRNLFSDWQYFDLEKTSDFTPLSEDPEGRLKQLSSRVIFDEAQQCPPLFSALRSFVDEPENKNRQFILLGSASPKLIEEISESLAGRTTFLELTPFLYQEIHHKDGSYDLNRLWFQGGFPIPFLTTDNDALIDWFEAFTRTFIERDLSVLGIDISSSNMRRLWTMLAHYNGNIWNASQLAASMGVNYQTVNRYTDILEQTFLIRKLTPYYRNIGKRLIKSPRVYFRDTGLLHFFSGIRDLEQLQTNPARGHSWEAFVIQQICALFSLYIPGSQFYFWRTARGAEVDLLIDVGSHLIPFEIKLHSAPGKGLIKGLTSCMKDLHIEKGYIIYPGQEIYTLNENITVIPIEKLLLDAGFLRKL